MTFGNASRWITGLLLLVVLGGGVYIARALTASAREDARRERLRDEFRATRAAVDSCRTATAAAQESLQADNRRIDSLRRTVRAYESGEDGGVPGDEYETYLTAFDSYNAAVATWRERADSLRARSDGCRGMARRQNRLADSLRRMVESRRDESR